MTVYQVYPGIQLIYNDFEAAGRKWDSAVDSDILEINHCRWFSKAVAWADANGLLPGYEDGVTDPTAGLTGDEAAAILTGYAEKQGITLEEGALPGGDGTVSRAALTSVLAHFVDSAA